MLEKQLKYIELDGKKYPYKCTMNVIEKLQDKYGSIQAFEMNLKFRNQNPEAEDLKLEIGIEPMCYALTEMVREGLEIEDGGMEPLKEKEVRMIAGDEYGLYELFEIVNEEFTRCFASKKQKNVKSTQGSRTRK